MDYNISIKRLDDKYTLSLTMWGISILTVTHKSFTGIEIELSKIRRIINESSGKSISEIKNKIDSRWEK